MPIIAILASLLSFNAFAYEIGLSDSGIHGPKYAQILSQMDKLQAAHPKLVTVIEYGQTIKGRPLKMLVVKKAGSFGDRPAMLMSGSTHGDEYLNIEDRLPTELIERAARNNGNVVSRYVNAGGAFVFIPILNPDGYEARKRGNAHGVDLNRDWDLPAANFHSFKEPETRALADKLANLNSELKYKVTVDYHCCAGAVLYPWGWTDNHIPTADLTRHQNLAAMAAKQLDIDTGITSDVLGYYSKGTTKDYYYSTYGAMAFTYEGRYNKESALFDKHVAWWEDMVQAVMDQPSHTPLVAMWPGRKHALIRMAD